MIIYIRHGDDDGPVEHRHDQRLSEKGKKRSSRMAKRLIKRFGHPSIIYVSPFQRTLETVAAMSGQFKRTVTLKIDPKLSRYFSSKEQADPSVYPETKKVNVPIYEKKDDFKRRVKDHIHRTRKAKHHKSSKVVWVITHTLVIKEVGRYWELDMPEHFEFLEWFTIEKA